MIQKITKELMKTMDKYNEMKALKNEEPTNGREDGLADLFEQMQAPHKETRFEIDVGQYWKSMIRAKIELMGAIGGKDLIQDVFNELQKRDVDKQNRYEGIFKSVGAGIQGWYD